MFASQAGWRGRPPLKVGVWARTSGAAGSKAAPSLLWELLGSDLCLQAVRNAVRLNLAVGLDRMALSKRALIKRALSGFGKHQGRGQLHFLDNTAIGGGPVTIRGGRYILTGPPLRGSVAMYEKGAGRDPYHDRPPSRGGPVKVYRDRPPWISRPAPPPSLTISYGNQAPEAPGSSRRQSRNNQSRGFPEPLSREQSYELC